MGAEPRFQGPGSDSVQERIDSLLPRKADSIRASPIRAGFVFALVAVAPNGARRPAGNLQLIGVGRASRRLDSAAGGG